MKAVILSLLTVFLAEYCCAQSKILTLATDDGPPHMIRETNSGIDIDIVSEVLKRAGYEVHIEYMSLARAQKAVETGNVDLVVPTFFQKDTKGFFVSEPVVLYRPTVFTRADEKLDFNSLASIKGLMVSSFQGAKGYFGKTFVEMTRNNSYMELDDMSVLPKLLERKRTNVVVLDYYLFQHYWNNERPLQEPRPSIKIHEIIPAIPAYAAFKDQTVRDKFNETLNQIISDGTRQAILDKYSSTQFANANDR
ncbi:ABC transporter substrate-binding protein [Kordiimonas sp. SCSIO 12610]|uniref:substrate-binding periplasmic protein n=1 Tax=Kordiimonas sp. SCSIO 12610 TaxID=2829597 RepID=UPI00210CCCF6|nr:transporter substrate-binding domain-containing protein [Kordiimonas sp. SCSIO 12610]UTW54759.1 transporter substrate-binding domain-containing protein [Kordiimonas sp. SCSIO 12610]